MKHNTLNTFICIFTLLFTIFLTSCGEKNYCGTWKLTKTEVNGSIVSIAEAEAMGDTSLSDSYIIIKEGGLAILIDGTNNSSVKWETTSNGIHIGKQDCEYKDDTIIVNKDGNKLIFEKHSDSQDLTDLPNASETSENKEVNATTDTQIISYEGIDFCVPTYFSEKDEKASVGTLHYYPEEKEEYASLIFESTEIQIEKNSLSSKLQEMMDSIIKKRASQQDIDVIFECEQTIAGFRGYKAGLKEDLPHKGFFYAALIYNDSTNSLIYMYMLVDHMESPKYDYKEGFEDIIKNSRPSTSTSSDDTSKEVEQADNADNSSDYDDESSTTNSNVNPDFKETMDKYEEFFDDYIEFMNKYNKSSDPISLMTEYTKWLSDYANMYEKLAEIDPNELSVADAAYYYEVYNRIIKKTSNLES